MVGQRPGWVQAVAERLHPLDPIWPPMSPGGRPAAVLALLSDAADPDLVLTLRSTELSHQPGQMALPGGGQEPVDRSPVETATRETTEEIGLPGQYIHPLGQLPMPARPVNRNLVVPVVAWWPGDIGLGPIDPAEVAAVVRWPVAQLADPACRRTARHPGGGTGPAWQVGGLFLWGFTASLVDALLRLAGWTQPWDETVVVEVPAQFRSDRRRV